MKSLFLSLLFLAPLARAQENAPVAVAPPEGRQLAITLPKGAPALVRDRRSVTLGGGRSLLRFPEVAQGDSLDESSLQLSLNRSVAVLRQESGNFSLPAYGLSAFVGKQITLLRPLGSAGERAVTGKLLQASNPVLLETAEGVLLNPPGVWVLPRAGASDTRSNSGDSFQWLVEAAQGGSFPIEATYATSNLSWAARYTATLAPARDRLSLRGWLSLTNSTQTAFPNATLTLRDANGVAFEWPRAVTIPREGTQLAYVAADVPVKETLIYDNGAPFLQPINGANPQRAMTLENSLANGLGVYLPQGALSLWQGEAGQTLRLDRTPNWGGFRPDDVIGVPLGAESSITIDRYIASSKLLNPVTREVVVAWKVAAQNGSSNVTIIDNVPPRFKLTSATQKPVSVANNRLRFEVNVTANMPVEFRYTVEVPAS